MKRFKNSQMGLTLIEVIVSIALLGLIIIAFMPFFTTAIKANSISETTLNSTYTGKDVMESIYYMSQNIPYEDLENELKNEGYIQNESQASFNYQYDNKKYLDMSFKEEGNLIRVLVKIYDNKNMDNLEVQYESLYSWLGRGILSEE